MDGSSLAEPFQFEFRVRGPRVLAGLPAGPDQQARFLPANPRFQIVLSGSADPALLARLIYLEMNRACASPGVIALKPGAEAPIPDDAPWQFKEAGGYERERSADGLRRVVTLTPERPLPYGCVGDLVVPEAIDAEKPGKLTRWGIQAYGKFELTQADCRGNTFCPNGPIALTFSTPVKGADLLRHLTVLPKVDFGIPDTTEVSDRWVVSVQLKPRTGYLVRVDSTLRDTFGQPITGYPVKTVVTTGYRADVSYAQGKAMVERVGRRTFGITYVNVDTLEVLTIPVPDSLEGRFLSRSEYGWGDDWKALVGKAVRKRIPLGAARDRVSLYGYEMPAPDASKPGTPTLFLVRATSPRLRSPDTSDAQLEPRQPIALLQVTDLGVHAKIGLEEGVVWVTGASDGKPRTGASAVLRDAAGRVLARAVTDSQGLARFRGIKRPPPKPSSTGRVDYETANFDGYVEVRLGSDRALVGVNQYDPDLSPWRFNVRSAYGDERLPAAAAVFTERGIYRPGDTVYAKAIVRTGLLGALKVPARGDSVKVAFKDRDEGMLRETVSAASAFGTLQQSVRLPRTAPLGYYTVAVSLKRQGEWKEMAQASYRVAEYRPPEFLVDMTADNAARFDGDTLIATIGARYLFGAPMGRAKVAWSVRQTAYSPWETDIPNTDGFYVGAQGWWWEEMQSEDRTTVSESRVDTLDATGHLTVRAPLKLVQEGRATQATIEAVVTDVNRQTVYASTGALVHPAEFYLGAKPEGSTYFWKAAASQAVRVIAVKPDGARLDGIKVSGVLVRREWHQVRREQDGWSQLVGEWVSDTVARCNVTTAANNALCVVTPALAGSYSMEFRARDRKGREVVTSFYRWATGPGWVPWSDESQFKMDVIPDKTRYSVGDTATILFAAPFTNAEAWITVEREGLLQQRRMRITEGATTLKFPITEAWAPDAFVSIVVARGRSAVPGPLDDPGRPTIRVGYAEIRVTPERKRLTVALRPEQTEYRPGDRARIRIEVRDTAVHRGMRSEVTLWAVDEGVLSLTGYQTPDPIDLLYRERGLGMRLASNLVSVAPQVPAGDKGRNPGGGGGEGAADVLRSRFRTTAFFLGSVLTDSAGNATATAPLPDNLTTFRLMAVAVTAGDRYGKGQSPLLVTRPLLARAALPRFLRPGDKLEAGVVVNHRLGGTPTVRVAARVTGATLTGEASRSVTLEAGRGRESRFGFTALPGDSATFRFDVGGSGDSDAVQVKLPILPPSRAGSAVASGVLHDTASVVFMLPGGLDLARSRITLTAGGSPLTLLASYASYFRIYPYLCSEQVASAMTPLLGLYRARKTAGAAAGDTLALRREIVTGIEMLVRRQRPAGGIGLWSAEDWTSPWLTAEAGAVLLEARDAGFAIGDSTVAKIAEYLRESLKRTEWMTLSMASAQNPTQWRLTERLAVADFLSRARKRDRALENDLARQAALLSPESRLTLALVLARGGDLPGARGLLQPVWNSVRVEGRTVSVPDSLTSGFYFRSAVRPVALLLEATLAVDSSHALLVPLFETVVTRARPRDAWWWNTQDYAAAVRAVNAWMRRFPPGGPPEIRVRVGASVLTGRDTSVALSGLLPERGDSVPLQVRLENGRPNASAFYTLTISEIPRAVPARPEYHGIVVERWYEAYEGGKPEVEAGEGDLVRVRLKITVPQDRSFVVVDDALPAGLEAVDLSLNTVGLLSGPGAERETPADEEGEGRGDAEEGDRWDFGAWDGGWWSPFDHREIRDDRVVYAARVLWKGTYSMTYVARATTPGVFVRPPAFAEEMYNPAVYGRTEGGTFTVRVKTP
ncbi:MAG TPA: MG2 domain-containing protein [Gemmatimonadales bacterium]|nr:MG2 domain-containing protein [Gemmatimonadales bacterium]